MNEHFQTVVIGAGVAGVAAATASARHGVRTLLIEAGSCAGGMGSAGLVPTFTPFSYKKRPIVGGIAAELHNKLCQYGGSNRNPWPLIDAEWMKYVCDEILAEAGVEVRYMTAFRGVETDARHIRAIHLFDRSGDYCVFGDNFIDSSGDAVLAHAAGVQMKIGDENGRTQPGSCCFVLAGINAEKLCSAAVDECNKSEVIHLTDILRKRLLEYLRNGDLVNSEDFEFHVAGANLDTECGIMRVNFGHFYGLGSCENSRISWMLTEGRRRIREFVECLRKHMPGMENAVLVSTPSLPDIRESRRIVGRKVLSGAAFWNGELHEDDIALYDYCIDVHALSLQESLNGVEPAFVQKLTETKIEKYYGIPFGCCLTQEFDNLAVVGRCVSATRDMLGALRVMPAAMSTGQAAGTAAALSVPLSDVDIVQLRETLKNDGVILQFSAESAELDLQELS